MGHALRNPFYHRQAITDPRWFFGRGALVRSLFEMIDSGQSCAVVGERRIGKSSLLAYLADPAVQSSHGLDPERTIPAVLDFLALHTCSPEDLWLEILESLELGAEDPKAQRLLEKALQRSELNFSGFRRVMRKLKRGGFRVVLLCDEFELAVQNPQFDGQFFGALRSLAGGEGVVFITASRSSLLELGQYRDESVRQKVLGSPFFNIFAEFMVGPFKDYEVAELLAGSLEETPIRLSRDDVVFLERIAGFHPYFLQLSAYHLFEALRQAGLGRQVRPDAPSPAEGLRKCHEEVGERVLQESAKIFRNQWNHSNEAEVLALVALATGDDENPEGQALGSGPLAGRVIARLEGRGLVKEVRRKDSDPRRRFRQTTLTSRRFRLFSELFGEWILRRTPGPVLEEGSRGAPVVHRIVSSAEEIPKIEGADLPGRYQLVEEIGHGGAGTVFKAWDDRLERLVAIKVLDRRIREVPERLDLLLREARVCAALHHPHIVTVYDIDPEQGYLVQEFLAGGSLRDLLEMLPVLPVGDLVNLGAHLGSALDAAHRAGVVHRDIKPENILLDARPSLRTSRAGRPLLGEVKLADFGTALRLGEFGSSSERRAITGTLAYMAPEQLAGEEVGPAADLYALGSVLFEARHGYPPKVEGPESDETTRSLDPLEELILRCLMRDPRVRFATAEAFLAAVERARGLLAEKAAGPMGSRGGAS